MEERVHRIGERTAAGREEDAAVGQTGFGRVLVRAPESLVAEDLAVSSSRRRIASRRCRRVGSSGGRERDGPVGGGPCAIVARARIRVPVQRHLTHEARAAVHWVQRRRQPRRLDRGQVAADAVHHRYKGSHFCKWISLIILIAFVNSKKCKSIQKGYIKYRIIYIYKEYSMHNEIMKYEWMKDLTENEMRVYRYRHILYV